MSDENHICHRDVSYCPECEVERLTVEVERLRGALIRIVKYSRQPNSMGACSWDYQIEIGDMRKIAREALEATNE